ncbi:hypothetical protein [Rhizorhabdus phycosphaerae]|uniref:hypothetical protein n=1 Tax=Rhizorhabdus phycosphaerae TaxID=2711156 RepID=UPI0013EA7E37|nr:hypothetical protein [Rhizorhabdus phycosphaerae]
MERPDREAFDLRQPPVAGRWLDIGTQANSVTADEVQGLWTLRFGPFGCRDDETRGGMVHVDGDRMAGGDGHVIFHGGFRLDGTTLRAALTIVRHGFGGGYQRMFGTNEPIFRLEVVAEVISPDLFEGRIERHGEPDIRVVMRRLEPMTKRSQIV